MINTCNRYTSPKRSTDDIASLIRIETDRRTVFGKSRFKRLTCT